MAREAEIVAAVEEPSPLVEACAACEQGCKDVGIKSLVLGAVTNLIPSVSISLRLAQAETVLVGVLSLPKHWIWADEGELVDGEAGFCRKIRKTAGLRRKEV